MEIFSVQAKIVPFSREHTDACALWGTTQSTTSIPWSSLRELGNENRPKLIPLTEGFDEESPCASVQLVKIDPPLDGHLQYVIIYPNPQEAPGVPNEQAVIGMTQTALKVLNKLGAQAVAMNCIRALSVVPFGLYGRVVKGTHPLDDTEDQATAYFWGADEDNTERTKHFAQKQFDAALEWARDAGVDCQIKTLYLVDTNGLFNHAAPQFKPRQA